jgi:NitT/TauT family transport system permease protein
MTALSSATEDSVGQAVTGAVVPSSGRVALVAGAAAGTWLLLATVTLAWPDIGAWGRGFELASGAIGLAVFLLAGSLASRRAGRLGPRIRSLLPWAFVLGISATLWQVLTAKTGILPMPFFPPPHALLEVFLDEGDKLVESIVASMQLLGLCIVIGIGAGFATGVAIGWSRGFGYWIHPILRLVGPLPAIAWLPLAFFAFPSSFSASVFLIALAVGFPVTVLTWSGVASANPAYYDVARTLGANERFLILKVAIPAALPHVFVGLFMGLGASFSVLVTAEMMGVKAGLGFYLQWAQGWAAYSNMYAVLLVMAALFSGLITLLFKLRDKVLAYQNRDVQW